MDVKSTELFVIEKLVQPTRAQMKNFLWKETEDISEAAADFFDLGPFSALLDRAVKISDSKAEGERKGAWSESKPGQLLSTSWHMVTCSS